MFQFKNFRLIWKLITVNGLLTITIILILSLIGFFESKNALEKVTFERLENIRETKATEVSELIEQMKHDLHLLANTPSLREMSQQLKGAYYGHPLASGEQKKQLRQYLQENFLPSYNDHSASPAKIDKFLPKSSIGAALQHAYIKENKNPTGEKHKLNRAGSSDYDQVHATYHPWLRDYLETYGYYDIFLIDPNQGDIFYSVFKEVDFATNLYRGPFQATNLAKLARKVSQSGKIAVTDFQPYAPSYLAAAAFIAAPVKVKGKTVAILAFQFPIDRINHLTTSDKQWEKYGYGQSGEVYLIGPDQLLRSESRFLIEDKKSYLQALKKAKIAPQTLKQIEKSNTGIGLQKVDSLAAREALAGKQGSQIITDYRGVSVLSSYKDLNLLGMKWAIIAEIDEAEAFAPIYKLEEHFALSGLVILLVGLGIVYLVSRSIAAPLLMLTTKIRQIADTKDLTVTMDLDQEDEVGQTIKSFNLFLGSLQEIFQQIHEDAKLLLASSGLLNDASQSLANNAEEIQAQGGIIASASEELTTNMNTVASATEETSANFTQINSSTKQLSTSIDSIASATNEANVNIQGMENNLEQIAKETEEVTKSFNDLSSAIANVNQQSQQALTISNQASQESTETQEILEQLNEMANQIGNIVRLIGNIAGQTNMLALNATIEATNAGEAGKGFSVVAEEVKGLSQKTSEANDEIRHHIESIQNQIAVSRGKIQSVVEVIQEVGKMSENIAQTMEEQNQNSQLVSGAMANINKATQHSLANTKEAVLGINETSRAVSEIATHSRESARNISEGVLGVEEIARSSDETAAGITEVNKSLQKNMLSINQVDGQAQKVSESSQELARVATELDKLLGTVKFTA